MGQSELGSNRVPLWRLPFCLRPLLRANERRRDPTPFFHPSCLCRLSVSPVSLCASRFLLPFVLVGLLASRTLLPFSLPTLLVMQ